MMYIIFFQEFRQNYTGQLVHSQISLIEKETVSLEIPEANQDGKWVKDGWELTPKSLTVRNKFLNQVSYYCFNCLVRKEGHR